MKRIRISQILAGHEALLDQEINVKGWVRAFRSNRFVQLNDGSCMANLQAVIDFENWDEALLKRITTAAALSLTGQLVASQGSGQAVELQVSGIEILGDAHPDEVQKTVMQPKRHSLDFLREQAHLRFRTNTFGAVFRIRHAVSYAIHKYFNDTDSVANGGLDLYPHQGIGFDEHYNEAITMGDINNNPSTSFRVFRTADTTDFASLPISASDWFDFNSRPIFFLKPKTDPSDITSNFGLFVIKNLLRPFGYADGQEVSPDAIKEWSDDTNFFNMASNDNGNANAIIDDNIVQHYQNPLEPLNPFTTVSASSYISAITYGMKIGDSNKWGGGSGANVSSLFYNNNHTAVVGDGTYSATEAISSELEGHDVGLTSVVCKAVGLYTISGRITLPRDGLKSIRILKWVKSDIDVDGNGDDVIQVPEIVYNASFSETQSIINIDTSFFVENANDEIFMSLVGVYEEAVDASVSAIRDVLPNQWQSDYLHIAYKGYTAESQAWANYNGISSSNS